MQSKTLKKALSLLLSIAMLAVSVFTGVTVSAEDSVYEATRITIHPGIDDTYLNYAWQSEELANPATVRIKAENSDEWKVFTGESKAFVIKDGYEEGYHDTFVKNCGHTCADVCGHEACTASQCYHGTYTLPYYNMVTVSGLEYGVSYTYQLGDGTSWSKEYSISIADSDPNEGFSYLVFGDSQTADQYYGDYMKKALELSTNKFSDIDFLMNLGDNVHENNDRNYNAYYTAQDILASYPIAVVLGNHELNLCTNGDRINFSDHPTLALQNPPAADGRQDHWFRYGDALFITFNSGPQQTSMFSDLEQLIIDAKAAHPDTRWTILQTHQSFYGNNGSGKVWRKNFMNVLSKYDIDMVFVGHAHQYTRSESIVYDNTATCTMGCTASNPSFDCAACSGSVEPLGENDVTVKENFIGATNVIDEKYDELAPVEYDKTVERFDPEGITVIQLDSLTAEGHDTYASTASATLKATTAFANNSISGQGAITKVTVNNDQLKVETYWINNGGTPRVSDSASLTLLDDDYIEDTPYDTYTIHKTTETKDREVTFDGGTDRGIFTRKVNADEAVAEPANPIMTGKSFKYWSLDGETEYDFDNIVTENITLTAVYEEIPPTTTADLFVEAVNRGDSEIILDADITLTDLGDITIKTGTTITSAEGQQYTITLDGTSRLVTAAGSKVTFRNIDITLASTIATMSSGYTSGGYIKTGSGNSKLYIYNCNIHCAATAMGASNCAIIRPAENTYSQIYVYDSSITSNTNNSAGALIGGNNATFYVTNSTLKPKASNYWLSADNPTLVLKGTSTYTGWCSNAALAKIYNFVGASVKISRNSDNLIELSKIGSGAAVTNDNYKIYYAFEDTAFDDGTAVEYTAPIADVDYETPVYATIKYTGKSYYGDVTSKACGEYIDGVLVDTAEAFVQAINNGDSPINLTTDITLTDLDEISFAANTVVQSKSGGQHSVTLDGNSRLTVPAGKTVTFKNIDIVIAETSAVVSDPWTYGDKITVGSDNSAATLYVEGCNIECKATSIGGSSNAIILSHQNAASKIYINNSTITSSVANGSGCILAGGNNSPVFRVTNSTLSCVDSSAWFCNSGIVLITEGTTATTGWIHSSAKHYDLSKAFVKAARNKDGLIELSKTGTGTAATDDNYKIYYSVGEDTSGTTTEYTEPIADIGYETPVYVTIRYPGTSYYTTAEAKVCGEYIEGIGVATAEEFTTAVAYKESVITLTADITLTDLGLITIPTGTKIQSKTGSTYTITLDGSSRLATSSASTVIFENFNITIASTIDTVTELGFTNGWYAGGYIKTGSGSDKLYIRNCTIDCQATTFGTSDAAIIRPYGNGRSYVYIENSTITANLATDKGALLGGQGGVFYITDSYLKAKNGGWDATDGSGSWLAVSSPNMVLEGETTVLGYYKAYIRDFRNASVAAERDADGNVVLTKTGTGTAVTNTNYIIKYSTDNSTYTEYTAPIENISADTTLYVSIYYTGTSYGSTPAELTVPEKVVGDLNGDNIVDGADLTIVRQHIIGVATAENADVNGDGDVDICDLVALSNLIA